LWQEGHEKLYWAKILKVKLEKISIDENDLYKESAYTNHFCEGLLLAEEIDDEHLQVLCRIFSIDEVELKYSNLLEGAKINILAQNLKNLCSGLGTGGKTQLSDTLEVHKTTLSRWLSGIQKPDSIKLKKISDFFGISYAERLTDYPFFLCVSPVTEFEKKAWMVSKIEHMHRESLNRLFPALEKLLE